MRPEFGIEQSDTMLSNSHYSGNASPHQGKHASQRTHPGDKERCLVIFSPILLLLIMISQVHGIVPHSRPKLLALDTRAVIPSGSNQKDMIQVCLTLI